MLQALIEKTENERITLQEKLLLELQENEKTKSSMGEVQEARDEL